jgi:hypothetical protein
MARREREWHCQAKMKLEALLDGNGCLREEGNAGG